MWVIKYTAQKTVCPYYVGIGHVESLNREEFIWTKHQMYAKRYIWKEDAERFISEVGVGSMKVIKIVPKNKWKNYVSDYPKCIVNGQRV